MENRICMNVSCGTKSAHEWRKGWRLPSGELVDLCEQCGSAYENSTFCETFHSEESGWRKCKYCDKSVHCGCIVSRLSFEVLDYGGVRCKECPKNAQHHTFPSAVDKREDENKSVHFYKFMGSGESISIGFNQENVHLVDESANNLSNISPPVSISSEDDIRLQEKLKHLKKLPPHTSLDLSLEDLLGGSNFNVPFLTDHLERSETTAEPPSSPQGVSSYPILPSFSKLSSAVSAGTSNVMVPQVRVARPPAEGRGKNQLLHRYWPRITDQELQQLSGDLNSTIVPLFEKVLSASDAGRIGRLVLPKACAEAYFPPISQSEGVPVRIQDVKGNEWTFQFRFWPNNNSRMYVLEGVTPCIQSMQLRAGDTVIFSRITPEGKLVMGFRKASHSLEPQERGTSTRTPSRAINIPEVGGCADLAHALKGKKGALPGSPVQNTQDTEGGKKTTRNIGSKSRRLLMHDEDAMELRLTWEEAQDLLRPPPSVNPSIVTIEGHDFEEYNEPPVFGKRTVYKRRSSGDLEQWAQCDDCSKWRQLPVDVLLPPKWACLDNVWDSERRFCSSPNEMNPKELDDLLRVSKDTKKRGLLDNLNGCSAVDNEVCGLDALASAAVLGESMVELVPLGEKSAGLTTKHPRHRAGCTCIVCIQPPSGKGKHRSTCTCTVCMTVKRRFKTLMLRKKKQRQQSECEQQSDIASACFLTIHRGVESPQLMDESSLSETSEEREALIEKSDSAAETGCNNGRIDLNCDPDSEEMVGFDDKSHATPDNIINSLPISGSLLPSIDDYPIIASMSGCFKQLPQEHALGYQSSNLVSICQVEDDAAENQRHQTPPNEDAIASLAEKGENTDDDNHEVAGNGGLDANPS
ncbi:hypothetical protein SAY87_013961 [Trapa incisa]|uniref:Uncharacterized protein n=1 Tax=Trapa incisa TaxID=236973 RepID=A0AAN7QE17_9MYRT|nr:hypothetical protein SAY87_013961 [Trapa incisa]